MTNRSFFTSYTPRKDIASRTAYDGIEPRMDPALTGKLPDDRVVARNRSGAVIVCLSPHDYPVIGDGGAQFASIETGAITQTVDELAASLETAESILEPNHGPETCYYGVVVEPIQLISNTPTRFLADLQNTQSLVTELAASSADRSYQTTRDTVVGVCVWPTSQGRFYCKASRRDTTGEFHVQYGIFRYGIPLDTTPIERFFESITDEPPTAFTPWPLRQIMLNGDRSIHIAHHEPISDAHVTPDSKSAPRLTHCAENPFYGVHGDEFGMATDDPGKSLYIRLQSISTLAYGVRGIPEGEMYALDKIIALDPPLNGLCLVRATLDRER